MNPETLVYLIEGFRWPSMTLLLPWNSFRYEAKRTLQPLGRGGESLSRKERVGNLILSSILRTDTPWQGTPIVFCDFDGTITEVDVTDVILTQLAHPSWQQVEDAWVRGLIGSRECLERQMALVDASDDELHSVIDAIALDPHFPEFYRFVSKRNLPFYVVSDGFDYVIRRVLKRAGINGSLRNGSHLFSSGIRREGRRLLISFPHGDPPCQHGCATCKPRVMRRLVRQLGHRPKPVIFIGDGLSDRFAVEEADLVFAKRRLLSYCREKNIFCHPFETFADVEALMAERLESHRSGRKSKVGLRKSTRRPVVLSALNS